MFLMRNHFRYALSRLRGDARESVQIPEVYEQEAQVTGIAASYRFPDNMKAAEFDNWAQSYCRSGEGPPTQRQIKKVWHKLQDLNPALKELETYGNISCMRDGIMGSATQFNSDDIRFFIDFKNEIGPRMAALVNMNTAYADWEDTIARHTQVVMEWVASPQTLYKIHQQVCDRPLAPVEQRSFALSAQEAAQITPATRAAAIAFVNQRMKKPFMP